jgi:hypothetical protein
LVKEMCAAALVRSIAYSAAALSKEFEVVEGKVPHSAFSGSALHPPYLILVLSVHHIELVKQFISDQVLHIENIRKALRISNAQIPL